MSAARARVSDAGRDDIVVPYTVESLSTRGRLVRLGPAIDAILKRHAYPAPVGKVVGEAAALTVLLGSTLKMEGSFQLQTKTDGALNMLIVDFDAPSNLRALARFDEKALASAIGRGRRHPRLRPSRLHDRVGARASRYQGVIALDGQGLEASRALNISSAPNRSRRSSASPSARASRPTARNGARAACSRNSCRTRPSGAVTPISIPATRRRASSTKPRPKTMNGSRPSRSPRRRRITN